MLIIHTALHAEARALINHFQLKRQHDLKTFACFSADDIFLVESGIGKIDTATAMGWVGARMDHPQPAWLNIGMAGHSSLDIGEIRLAHRIEDQASGHRYYPPQLKKNLPPGENLLTVDHPVKNYPVDAMVDMESSAFVRSANRFSTIELIQCVKIISDNPSHPPARMKAAQVEALVAPHIDAIEQLAGHLLSLGQLTRDETSNVQEDILNRWHFSQYQRNQVRRLIQRYRALNADKSIVDSIPASINSSKQMIRWLNDALGESTISY